MRALPRAATSGRELQYAAARTILPHSFRSRRVLFSSQEVLAYVYNCGQNNTAYVPKTHQVHKWFWWCPGVRYFHARMTSNIATQAGIPLELQNTRSPLKVTSKLDLIRLNVLAER